MALKAVRNSLIKIAEKKANANCLGFMYEPKKPGKLVKQFLGKIGIAMWYIVCE